VDYCAENLNISTSSARNVVVLAAAIPGNTWMNSMNMRKHMKKLSFKSQLLALALLTGLSNNLWANVRAFVNQNEIFAGDPLTLTIEANGNTSARPDLSVLNKEFQIVGTSTGSSTTIINGNVSSRKSWTISISPRHKGQITIPPINVGQQKTAAITIKVSAAPPQVQAQTSQHIFLQAFIDQSEPASSVFVQQQVPYTVKLYYDDTIEQGELIPPASDNAAIEQIGDDKQYAVTRNGKNMNVIERHYVISPQKSGKLHIDPVIFKGTMQNDQQPSAPTGRNRLFQDFFGNDPFFSNSPFGNSPFANTPFGKDPFGSSLFSTPGKQITVAGDSIDINVKPIPLSYKGKEWIPAEALQIEDSWKGVQPEFRVGEPVTRILILKAQGLSGSQLPELKLPDSSGLRIYSDPAKRETRTDGNTVFGILTQTFNYIPNASGELTVPGINIDWWDVKNKQQRTLTLPARNFKALPAIATSQPQAAASSAPASRNNAQPQQSAPTPQQGLSELSKDSREFWLIGAFALLLVGAMAVFIAIKKRQHQAQPVNGFPARKHAEQVEETAISKAQINIHKKKLLQQLQHACETDNPHQAAKALLALAQMEWPQEPYLNLRDIADRVGNGADEIRLLDHVLYAPDAGKWQGKALCRAVSQGFSARREPRSHASNSIDELYPSHAN
jgi:hypothetical protein